MRPLRYSIDVTSDGCCDHRAIPTDDDLHRHAAESLAQGARGFRRRWRSGLDPEASPTLRLEISGYEARQPGSRRQHRHPDGRGTCRSTRVAAFHLSRCARWPEGSGPTAACTRRRA